VPSGYLQLAHFREEGRSALRAEAKKVFAAAQAAESRGDYDIAIDSYRRAHELDPSLQVDGQIKRVTDQKIGFGERRCVEGNGEYSYGTNMAAAIAAYQDVVRTLPPSHPCHATARQRLKQLGK
jgi:tetratricopeptide (TPR) repeat protein